MVPTSTNIQKAIATAGGGLEWKQKEALAHSMSHTKATANIHQRAYRLANTHCETRVVVSSASFLNRTFVASSLL